MQIIDSRIKMPANALEKNEAVQQAILNAKKEWETTFDSITDLLILTDSNGIIQRMNRATIDALNTSYQKMLGKKIESIFATDVPSPAKGNLCDLECKLKSKETFYRLSSTKVTLDSDKIAFVYSLHDISRQKRDEDLILRQNQYYESVLFFWSTITASNSLKFWSVFCINGPHPSQTIAFALATYVPGINISFDFSLVPLEG